MNILRQSSIITPSQQEEYYAMNVWREMEVQQPKNILMIYQENDEPIGYGALVHIAWEHLRAEISYLLNPYLVCGTDDISRYFASFLKLIKVLAFEDLGFKRLFTETYAARTHHIATLEATGFRREGVLKRHVPVDGQESDSIIHGCLSSYAR
jgi:RimJ/RimL family protein N-acetyltransferase